MEDEFVRLLVAQSPIILILLYIMREQQIRINFLLSKLIDKHGDDKSGDEVE